MNIAYYPNKLLLIPTIPVAEHEFGTPALNQTIDEMFILMHKMKGVGLAHNQTIGGNKNIFVVKLDGNREVFINFKILLKDFEPKEMTESKESCLSLPGIDPVLKYRFKTIETEYRTIGGEKKLENIGGFKAIVIQHEFFHILGKTIICDLPRLKRQILAKKIQKFVK
ncbi:peptide deformylase [Candidatus Pacearchaeota archaeon]|nr:peptide deformylase [Candidatus Pacearchaeota archaeon]